MKLKLILATSFFSLLLFTNETSILAKNNINDYGKENSLSTTTYNAKELIEYLTNSNISTIEENFIASNTTSFSYEDKIATSNIETIISSDSLIVKAFPYSYKANNEKIVTYIPTTATINDLTINLDKVSDYYEGTFTNINETDEIVTINYETTFYLDKDSINSLLNYTYNYIDDFVKEDVINKKEKEYQDALAIYNEDLIKYENYLKDKEQYQIDYQNYLNYLANLKEYEAKEKEYQAYLTEYNEYLKELEAYNNYLINLDNYNANLKAYNQYLIDLENYQKEYDEKIEAYNTYLAKKTKIDKQLAGMALIKTSMTSLNRDIYSAVMGDTVTSVLARKSDLSQLNADEDVITDAEEATYSLRNIFTSYFGFSSDEEKYQYYLANYRSIKNNLEKLLRALDKLYRSGWVANAISSQGKTEKYLILVAQLALVCNAIDDNPVYNYEAWNGTSGNLNKKNADIFDEDWTIDNKTIATILENETYFIDTNEAYPKGEYPTEVKMPTEPEVVTNPGTAPEVVTSPIAPTVVEKPDEIKEVSKPNEVIEVTKPIAPEPYVIDEITSQLLEAYNNKTIAYRTPYDNDIPFIVNSKVSKNFKNSSNIGISFYNTDNTLINFYVVEKDSYLVYEDKIPIKNGDEIYDNYTFDHWEYEDGTILDINKISKSGAVYPIFKEGKLKDYTITWIIENETFNETYHYNDLPSCKEELVKEFNGDYYYEFASFDKEITNVTSDTTYVAIFNSLPIVKDSNDQLVNIKKDSDGYVLNIEENKLDLELFFNYYINKEDFISLKIITNKFEIELPYATLHALKDANFKIIQINNDAKTYKVILLDKANNSIDNLAINVKFYDTFDTSHAHLYHNDEEIRASIKRNYISFSLISSETYKVQAIYSINVSTSDNIEITLPSSASSLEKISFTPKILEEGIKLGEIKIYQADGEAIDFNIDEGTYEFIMPENDVYIVTSFTKITYTITFIVEDNVVSSKTYYYGDEVTLPYTPSKASDGEYSYTFISWDKEISKVTKDETYTAIFKASELEKEEIPQQKSIIKPIKITLFSLIGAGSVFTILFIFLRKRRKK